MGKVAKTSSTRKVTPKLKNKRRKKELDKIHSKILKAKSKLDNIEKHGTRSRQKKQNQAKICNRLLPKPVAGIYRNGAKGKDVQKAETSENKINNARLKADALQLFNGDTPESKEDRAEITLFDKSIVQSPTKRFVENNLEWAACGSEESPVLGQRQDHNQNMCLVKKKSEDTFFKNLNSNRNRKDVNKSKDTVQKEVICKRKLFQNDEQSRVVNASTLQIFDTIDLTQEDMSEEKEEETCLKDKSCSSFNKNIFWNPSSRYEEFCRKMSAGISDGFTQIYGLDPVKMTLKKLRVNYAECLRQQLLREKRAQSINTESVEYQACTYSDSQISPVEFEVPKCDDENDTIAANLSESITQKTNKVHRMSHFMREKVNDMTQYDSISRSSQNSFAAYTNDENNQFADVFQPLKPMNLCFANETHSVDAQKNSNHVGRASKQNRHKKGDFFVNYHKHPRDIDNTGHPATLIFSKDSALSAEKPLPKLPTVVADTCALNDTFRKHNDRTANEYKNIKQIPKIIRRCNDISNINKIRSTQVNDICTESLYKKFETTLFNNGPNNNTTNRSRATEYPNVLDSVLTSSISNISFPPTPRYFTIPFDRSQLLERPIKCNYISKISNMPFDRSKLSEPQIESTKIKNIPRFNIEQANQVPSQTKVHICEPGNAKQQFIGGGTRDQNPNILFNSVGNKVAPTATLGCPQNSQCDKRCGEPTCEKLFSKADAERAKTRTDQNACRCNEQCIYHDSADYPFKHSVSQARHFHEDTVQPQPGTSYEINAYSSNTDKPADPSGGLRNVSFLPVEQRYNPYTYLKAADGQHRVELLQNATQPIKYFAVKNDSGVRRIPVYINNGTVEMTDNVPLKVVALMDPSSRTKAYAQEVTNQVIPLQANGLPVNEFAVNRTNVQPVLLSSDLQSNTWYASNL